MQHNNYLEIYYPVNHVRVKMSKKLSDLIVDVIDWHYARNLIDGSTDKDQCLKLLQEVGELGDNLLRDECIKDDIGDILVVGLNILERNKISLVECLNYGKLECDLDETLNNHIVQNETNAVYDLFCVYEFYYQLVNDLGKLSDDICKNKNISTSMNEIIKGLINISYMDKLTIKECLQAAYDDIKDRKGKMVDGVFVKEGDMLATDKEGY